MFRIRSIDIQPPMHMQWAALSTCRQLVPMHACPLFVTYDLVSPERERDLLHHSQPN